MKTRVGVLFSPRGAATIRDIHIAARDDIEVFPLVRIGVAEQRRGFDTLVTRLFGPPTYVSEGQLKPPQVPVAGVVTFSDAELELAAGIAECLNITNRRAVLADKLHQRTVLGAAGLSRVAARPLSDAKDLATALAVLGLPFVVKPRRGAGGVGVCVIDSAEACAAFERNWRNGSSLYAEQYIRDADPGNRTWKADYVSVEVQSVGGRHEVITVFSKFPVFTRSGRCETSGQVVTTGDILPCRLPSDLRNQVEELVVAAHYALGMDDGLSHTEVKLGEAGPEVIEVNCRVGGHLNRLLTRRSGFDMVRQALLIAAGLPPEPLPSDDIGKTVAGMFVPFASDEGPVLSHVPARLLRDAGAAAVDEVARKGACRADTDSIACNVVLQCASDGHLPQTVAEFLTQVRELFAADGVGSQDWTDEMLSHLTHSSFGRAYR